MAEPIGVAQIEKLGKQDWHDDKTGILGDWGIIPAARSCHGLTPEQALAKLDAAAAAFGRAARERFGRKGEW